MASAKARRKARGEKSQRNNDKLTRRQIRKAMGSRSARRANTKCYTNKSRVIRQKTAEKPRTRTARVIAALARGENVTVENLRRFIG